MAITPTSTPAPKTNRLGLQVIEYRGGKTTVIGFFVGQVMKLSKGQANPAMVNDLLKKKLG